MSQTSFVATFSHKATALLLLEVPSSAKQTCYCFPPFASLHQLWRSHFLQPPDPLQQLICHQEPQTSPRSRRSALAVKSSNSNRGSLIVKLVMASSSWDQGELHSCCKQRGVNSPRDDRCLQTRLLLSLPSGIAAPVTQHSRLGIQECARH